MAHVRRRGPNTYEIRVYLGRDAGGKKKYLIETFRGTRGQAQRRAAELEVLHRPRVSGPLKAAITLGEYLEKRWLPKAKAAVTERTGETYKWHVRRLLPAVGPLPLYGLTAGDLQDALESLQGSPVTRR
ncbi:MAG TPA: site-specific integrase, partial [Peptococcaceae bacterium]|nr:site-specific integrase [Peptococcaceae bacterium]